LQKSSDPLATPLHYTGAMQKLRLPELARIDTDPAYKSALAELTALEQRLAETQARRNRARARLRGATPTGSPLERAKKLLAGGQIGATDPVDDVRAADEEEFGILLPAIRQAAGKLDQVAGDLSFAASDRMRPAYIAAVKAALQAMSDLAAALDMLGAVRARLRELGYMPAEGILPSGAPRAAQALGSPDATGSSQAAIWREHLQRHGLL
jgi:hypothetical protein